MMLTLDARSKHLFRATIADTDSTATIDPDQLGTDLLRYAERQPGELIADRLQTTMRLHRMANDNEWELPPIDRKLIMATFSYLLDDKTNPVRSIENLLLKSLAIDLLAQDCDEEMNSYDEFCALRSDDSGTLSFRIETRSDWLHYKREQLRASGKPRRILGMRRSWMSRR